MNTLQSLRQRLEDYSSHSQLTVDMVMELVSNEFTVQDKVLPEPGDQVVVISGSRVYACTLLGYIPKHSIPTDLHKELLTKVRQQEHYSGHQLENLVLQDIKRHPSGRAILRIGSGLLVEELEQSSIKPVSTL